MFGGPALRVKGRIFVKQYIGYFHSQIKMLSRILLLLLCMVPIALRAQITSLQGSVVDSATGKKLPFVTILINHQSTSGTSSDSSGNFSLKSVQPITSVTFSYVGYRSKDVTFQSTDKASSLFIFLAPLYTELDDVTVISGENPANRIIKMAVKNRDQNNYGKLGSYAYKAYEKFVVTGIPPKHGAKDSLRKKLYRMLDGNHLLIMEAVIERKHLSPDLTKETVIAQKVSGLQSPDFTLLISEFQTTNFYEPYIDITTTDFVNPVSPGAWDKYFFNVEDTLYQGKDTVYVINYHPAKGKHFSSLKGVLEINTDGYAIQHVIATPSDTSLATVYTTIEHRYAKADSIHWFPTMLSVDLGFKKFIFNGLRLEMSGRMFIKDPVINPPLSSKEFDGVSIDILDDAAAIPEEYWHQNRLDTLTTKEVKTYAFMDSIGKKYRLDRRAKQFSALQDGHLRFPYVSIQIYNTIRFNPPERVRVGLGLETNSDFSRHYQLGAFAGYGIHDQRWKYGGFVLWKIYEPKNISLAFRTSINYEENGGVSFYQQDYWGSGTSARNYTISNFDLVDRKEVDFTARIRKYVNFQLTGYSTHRTVTNNYLFLDTSNGDAQVLNQFNFAGVRAAIRFSYKERVVESFEHYYLINQGYPTIWMQVTQGLKGVLGGDFSYTRYEARVNYSFNTKSFGITTLDIVGGLVDAVIPSSELFTGRSSYAAFGLYAPLSFQTMRSGEFLNDRYINIYVRQDFLSNVIQWGKFQPNFVLITSAGWGTLSHPEVHMNTSVKSMAKGYFESGIIANNLISKQFHGIVRFGVGAGVFYRYGAYAFTNQLDNLAFKGTFSYNFK